MNKISLKNNYNYLDFKQDDLTLMDIVIRTLFNLPALLKDGHVITLGGSGIGKTTALLSSTNKIKNITNPSSAAIFGNLKNEKDGCATSSAISK